PGVDIGRWVAGIDIRPAPHQPRVGEVRGRLIDRREFLVIGENDGYAVPARKVVEFRVLEALVAHLQRMAQGEPIDLAREKLEEALHILGIELLAGHELPVDGPQPVAQLGQALADEAPDAVARARQLPAIGAIARSFDQENEAPGGLVPPFRPTRRPEQGIVGAVDLDGGEAAAGELELAAVWKALGKEGASPGLIGPAANANADPALHGCPPGIITPLCLGDRQWVALGELS